MSCGYLPASDSGEAVRIEIRAAEIAAYLTTDDSDHYGPMNVQEHLGWHNSPNDITPCYEAGWLAHWIVG